MLKKIFISFLLSVALSKKHHNKNKKVPLGIGLSNHFGSDKNSGYYGPENSISFDKIEYRDHYGHI